jgi:hypothetical protein
MPAYRTPTCTLSRSAAARMRLRSRLSSRIRQRGVIGGGKSARRLRPEDERGRPRIDHICGTAKRVIRLSTGHRVVASSSRRKGRDPGSPRRHGTTPSGDCTAPSPPLVPLVPLVPLPAPVIARLISSDDGGETRSSRSRDPKLLNYFPIAIATDRLLAAVLAAVRIGSGTCARRVTSAVFLSDQSAERKIPRRCRDRARVVTWSLPGRQSAV